MKQHERRIVSSPGQEAEISSIKAKLTTSNIDVHLCPAVLYTYSCMYTGCLFIYIENRTHEIKTGKNGFIHKYIHSNTA